MPCSLSLSRLGMSAVAPFNFKRPGGHQIIQRSSFRALLCPTGKLTKDQDVNTTDIRKKKTNENKHIKFSNETNDAKEEEEESRYPRYEDEKNEKTRLMIPLFQRTYCWGPEMIISWWQDVLRGVRGVEQGLYATDQGLDVHNVGHIRMKKCDVGKEDWVVVDGQQRLTTTSLLLAAIWHAGRGLEGHGWGQLEQIIRACLFVGDGREEFKLAPSLPDREAYKAAVMEEHLDEASEESPQIVARRLFDKELKNYLMENCTGEKQKVEHLGRIVMSCLDWMSPMVVELTEIGNLSEIFQWYQEKALFGLASLLPGIPGVHFGASDLVRNFVMSVFMDLGLEQQEEAYREIWLEQVEKKAGGARNLEKHLDKFLSKEGFTFWDLQSDEEISRYTSVFEKQCRDARVKKLMDALEDAEDDPAAKEECITKARRKGGIELYCRFYSYFQELKAELFANGSDKDVVKLFTQNFEKYIKDK